ncbi:putative calcium-binding protein cnx1 [Venustampulla echinocandica]|uniref:Putative calcium-binding protein cnx1 n=1 Tax=Venustampulla echinocandica TaxID=2656787 RepID=A0A370TM83_9HELO|nr:putative calcium-binding protein cnx1 [Venustampulla echinocandica]RDL36624.1 putative calcium-binding protein cnx1 [Venustampulla echinocandica]
MRFHATAAFSAAALLAGVKADAQSVLSDASSAASSAASDASSVVSSATAAPELPTFTPSSVKADFVEQFTDGWDARWKPSHAKKDTTGSEEEWAYVGEWSVEEPTVYKGMEGDKGLVVKNAAAHHAISAKFPKKIENKGKTLVVQYEVKLQKGLECGGGYLKLLRDNKALHQDEFSNVSPYVVMFGPDKCGSTNKVHLIINHKNPKTGEYEEKHLAAPPAARIVKTTELYTLIIHPNNTAVIKLNGEQVKEANLLEDFQPAFNPAKEIDDPKDKKPDTWVDEAKIQDPEEKKPEDWDEDAPFEIVDEEATKPEGWLDDAPLTIPDPEAEKPADWDEEEDGDWVAPTVPNPKCDEAPGCGPWEKPMIKNPAYKGKWTASYIDNPAYKGTWSPRKIKNPDYYEDKTPSNLEPMGAIGFEIWTMQNDILFDNIYIGHSIKDAEKFAEDTFFKKHPVEQLLELADKPKEEEKPVKSPSDLVFMDDPVHYIKEKLDLFFTIAQNDPIQAIKFVPEAAGGLAAVAITLLAVIVGVVSMGGSSVPPKVKKAAESAKDKAADAKDKAAEAVSSGADQAKAEVNKRATRSTS